MSTAASLRRELLGVVPDDPRTALGLALFCAGAERHDTACRYFRIAFGGDLDEVLEWEFGSAEWCQFAGELGARLIRESDLELSKFEWGFSEIYTHTPERLMAGRDQAAFHFMITGGKVSGGAGAPP